MILNRVPARIALTLFGWLWCVGLGLSPPATAATPDETFNQIYQKRLQAAVTPAEKVAFAKQLAKDAGTLADDKPFQTFLYEKVYDLTATEPQGYSVALDAMTALAKVRPEFQSSANEKMLAVLERQYRSGSLADRRMAGERYIDLLDTQARAKADLGDYDQALALLQKATSVAQTAGREWSGELPAHVKTIRLKQESQKTADELKAKLERNPQDAKSAMDLVKLFVLDINQPAQALPYVKAAKSPPLTEFLDLAVRDPSSLTPDQALLAAAWYRGQASKASELGRTVALERSKTYYHQFLRTYSKEDANRLAAQTALEEVAKDLAKEKLSGSVPRIDLLALIDCSKDAVAGAWSEADGNVLAQPAYMAKLAIPYQPSQEYDLRVTFEKPPRTTLLIVLADGNRIFDWAAGVAVPGVSENSMSGLEAVKGKTLVSPSNVTRMLLPTSETPGPHKAEFRVRSDSITIYFDGARVMRYMTDSSDLSTQEFAALGGYPLGIVLGASQIAAAPTIFSSIELVEISGKGRAMKHRKP